MLVITVRILGPNRCLPISAVILLLSYYAVDAHRCLLQLSSYENDCCVPVAMKTVSDVKSGLWHQMNLLYIKSFFCRKTYEMLILLGFFYLQDVGNCHEIPSQYIASKAKHCLQGATPLPCRCRTQPFSCGFRGHWIVMPGGTHHHYYG